MDENKTVSVHLTSNELSLLYRHADEMCQTVEKEAPHVKAWHTLRDKIVKAIEEVRSE